MKPESTNAGSGVEKSRPGTGQGSTGKGTDQVRAHGNAESIERGRQIAVSMMDRAEAKYRHAHNQPHIREHCETCAEEYWSARLRPVHYREAAASLRKYARPGMHPEYVKGFISAAALLDSVAFDLGEEAGR